MSCDIRIYQHPGQYELSLTAMVGPAGDRGMIQFTLGNNYIQLGEKALLDMIATIARRLRYDEGFLATGSERENLYMLAVTEREDQ